MRIEWEGRGALLFGYEVVIPLMNTRYAFFLPESDLVIERGCE